jgi:nicotinamidase-related amidase
MPLTKLDPTPALVVIDMQKGIVSMPTVHPATEILGRISELARAFRERGFPVVLVNVNPGTPSRTNAGFPKFERPADWTELVPELNQQPADLLITKRRPGAFIGTTLNDDLRQRGVTQIFLTGISTSVGVESTGRSAFDHGYNVVFVTDAMTDRDPDSHRHTTEKIFPRIGETEITENVLKTLDKPK